VEADVNVDFEPPVGYVEPVRKKDAAASTAVSDNGSGKLQGSPTQASAAAAAAAAAGNRLGARAETAPATASSSSSLTAANSMAELAKAREERRKQLEAEKATYTAFSGSGRRVDGKIKQQPPRTLSEPVPAAAVAAEPGSVGSSKWKQRTKGAVFSGEGNRLS